MIVPNADSLTTGPIWVSSAVGSPTTSASARSLSNDRNASAMPSVSTSRDVAVHFCPVERKAPSSTCSTARSTSASSRTTAAFLPPISAWTGMPRAAPAAAIRRPTPVEPVNVRASTRLSFTMASPTPVSPTTRFNTPGGSPAASNAWARRMANSGTVLAGFHSTALPYTNAGAIFQAGMAIGKLNGVITPTTPRGLRVTRMCSPRRGELKISPVCRSPSLP
ncbi:Uncharacterised protein [Mycobacteroides abscessus subsp. abscessus]|nr:Uncharacterised protein [Mycobacteroides abscessus subsp. abscessus]